MIQGVRRPTPALAVLSLAVGMVLADSAIVTLALPAILGTWLLLSWLAVRTLRRVGPLSVEHGV